MFTAQLTVQFTAGVFSWELNFTWANRMFKQICIWHSNNNNKKTWSMNCYKATTVTSSVTDARCVCYLFSSYLVFILKYTLLRNTCRGKDVSFCDPDPSFDELHHCFLDELWVFALLLLVAVAIDAQMTVTNNHCPVWMTPKQLSKMCNLLDFFAQWEPRKIHLKQM